MREGIQNNSKAIEEIGQQLQQQVSLTLSKEDADKRKGTVEYDIGSDDEQKYVKNYQPLRDELIQWTVIQNLPTFAIKRYKDSIYRGELDPKSNKREGRGVIVYNSSRIYEGHWANDRRHGQGYEYFSNGNTYEGEYKTGKVWGQGKYIWQSGEFYEGQWVEGYKEGYGVWQGVAGDNYVGQWRANKPYGFGKHTWGNQDEYEGEWKACLRHG